MYTTSVIADLPTGLEFQHGNRGPGNEKLVISQESNLQKTSELLISLNE
jgi:hypothetical protein